MITIGVVSDSHGYVDLLENLLLHTRTWGITMWLHAGDYGDDAAHMARLTHIPVHYVRGNSDRKKPLAPREQLIPWAYGDIYITHGDGVSYYNHVQELLFLGRSMGANLIVSGHTHCRESYEQDGVLYVNPGSIALPRDGTKGTFAIVTYDGKQWGVRWYDAHTFKEVQG